MRIFNRNIGWYDIRTKFKQILRSIFYLKTTRFLVCLIIYGYIWLVFLTSRKKYIGFDEVIQLANKKESIILSFWHNRIAIGPFIARRISKKSNNQYRFLSLSSKHGDGQFIGVIMGFFGFKNVAGSTVDKRKPGRGIDLSSMRNMVKDLKQGYGLGITPDGPKGPNQKINGHVIEIAKMSKAYIVPASYSSSRFIQFNSWDKFKLPLPFSKIVFLVGDVIDPNAQDIDKDSLEIIMNDLQDQSERLL